MNIDFNPTRAGRGGSKRKCLCQKDLQKPVLPDRNRAFTLVELLVVIAIIGMLIALLLPAVQAAREAARRMQCTNQLRQLALACHNYHDIFNQLPPLGVRHSPNAGDNFRRGWRVDILPFIEQQSITDLIAGGGAVTSASGSWPSVAGGLDKVPWDSDYTPWQIYIAVFRCPSDGNAQTPGSGNNPNPASYRGCLGDLTWPWQHIANTDPVNQAGIQRLRGAFQFRHSSTNDTHRIGHGLEAISDGTSNTLLLSEALVNAEGGQGRLARGGLAMRMVPDYTPSACLANLDTQDRQSFLPTGFNVADGWFGRRWADAIPSQSGFYTNLPPNAPSCTWSSDQDTALIAASSNHVGGVNAARADGSVHFFSDTIDHGTLSATADPREQMGSPFGVWGALGSINAGN